jgi:hypothetical protein
VTVPSVTLSPRAGICTEFDMDSLPYLGRRAGTWCLFCSIGVAVRF